MFFFFLLTQIELPPSYLSAANQSCRFYCAPHPIHKSTKRRGNMREGAERKRRRKGEGMRNGRERGVEGGIGARV